MSFLLQFFMLLILLIHFGDIKIQFETIVMGKKIIGRNVIEGIIIESIKNVYSVSSMVLTVKRICNINS